MSRWIRAELQEAGIVVSSKRIARLMRQERMRGVSRRRHSGLNYQSPQ